MTNQKHESHNVVSLYRRKSTFGDAARSGLVAVGMTWPNRLIWQGEALSSVKTWPILPEIHRKITDYSQIIQ